MTLIEVLAGLVLLSTLLSSMLVAKGRWTHQYTVAQRHIEAIEAADALMSDWWTRKSELAHPADGRIDSLNLTWQRKIVANDDVKKLGGRIVRVEIFEDVREGNAGAVLATLDVVVPDETENH